MTLLTERLGDAGTNSRARLTTVTGVGRPFSGGAAHATYRSYSPGPAVKDRCSRTGLAGAVAVVRSSVKSSNGYKASRARTAVPSSAAFRWLSAASFA